MVSTVKAWVGAVLAALTALSVALKDHGSVNWGDIAAIVAAAMAGWQGVYWSPRYRRRSGGGQELSNGDSRPSRRNT